MEMTTPMQSKPLVNATCKLGKKGCYEDGRCHYIGNCVSKIETNADRIRAMTDEELAEFFWQMENGQIPLAVAYCKGVERCPAPDSIDLADCKKCLLDKLQQPCEDSPTVEKG